MTWSLHDIQTEEGREHVSVEWRLSCRDVHKDLAEVGHQNSSAWFGLDEYLVMKEHNEVSPQGNESGSIRLPFISTFSITASPALWDGGRPQ